MNTRGMTTKSTTRSHTAIRRCSTPVPSSLPIVSLRPRPNEFRIYEEHPKPVDQDALTGLSTHNCFRCHESERSTRRGGCDYRLCQARPPREQALLVEHVQEPEPGSDQHGREHAATSTAAKRARRARPPARPSASRGAGRATGPRPTRTTSGDRADAASRAPRVALSEQQHERPEPAEGGQDHERERPRREAVEEVLGVGVQHEDSHGGDAPATTAAHDGPAPEVLDHLVVASRRASQTR